MAPNTAARASKKRKTAEPAAAPAKIAAPVVEDSSDAESADEEETTGDVAATPTVGDEPTPESDNEDDEDKYASGTDSELEDEDDEYPVDDESDSEADSDIDDILRAQGGTLKKRKRNDADAFALSMGKILGSHLTTAARRDPVLVRAKQMQIGQDEAKLEAKARRVIKEEKRKEKEKGRVRELIPKDDDQAAKKAMEKERALKSIARSGVARLYNAIRAAQVKGEEAQNDAKKEGIVGMANRDAKGLCLWTVQRRAVLTVCSHRDVKTGILGADPGRRKEVDERAVHNFKYLFWRIVQVSRIVRVDMRSAPGTDHDYFHDVKSGMNFGIFAGRDVVVPPYFSVTAPFPIALNFLAMSNLDCAAEAEVNQPCPLALRTPLQQQLSNSTSSPLLVSTVLYLQYKL